MKNRLILFCLFVFLLPEFLKAQTNTPLTQEQKFWLSKASRHEKNGWLYLHIEGAPKERGFQHGYLLAKEIRESIRILSASWKYENALECSGLFSKPAGGLQLKLTRKILPKSMG